MIDAQSNAIVVGTQAHAKVVYTAVCVLFTRRYPAHTHSVPADLS